jgi:ribose transport system permease protein
MSDPTSVAQVAVTPAGGWLRGRNRQMLRFGLDNSVWIILILVLGVFSIGIDGFLSTQNFINIIYHGVFIGVLAIAETMCLIAGKMDLSIESTCAFGAMLAAYLMGTSQFASGLHMATPFAVLIVLAFGCAVGLLNALLIVKLKIDAFLVTLAMYILIRGLAEWLTEGKGVSLLPASFRLVDTIQIMGIPLMVFVMLGCYLLFFGVLGYTLFGRQLFVIGGNIDAAYKHGVPVDRVIYKLFALSGMLAAFTGLLLAARADGATAAAATWFLFDVLAAIVIGGVSLNGGRGSLVGVFAGVLLLSVIRSALNILAISPFITDVVRGLLVMFAIVLDSAKRMVR